MWPAMAPAAVSATSAPEAIDSRYPKRKRRDIKYFESDDEQDENCAPGGEMAPVKATKRAKRSAKPLIRQHIFPFMNLPAELRNKIYKECLIDDLGIYLRGKQSSYRRVVVRCPAKENDAQWATRQWSRRYYHRAQLQGQGTVTQTDPPAVNLLVASKQIFSEAAPMLYGQPIHVADTYALLSFVTQLTSRSAGMLRDLTIHSWCGSRSHKAINFPAMSALAASGAINLERLTLDCILGSFSYRRYYSNGGRVQLSHRVARKVYRDCYPWLEAVARGKGDRYAGVDALQISNENFREHIIYRPGTGDWGEISDEAVAEVKDMYRTELRMLLETH